MIVPTPSSGALALANDHRVVAGAILDAIERVKAIEPKRDNYLTENAYEQARDEHRARHAGLHAMAMEFGHIALLMEDRAKGVRGHCHDPA